jgi:hypothetical protein
MISFLAHTRIYRYIVDGWCRRRVPSAGSGIRRAVLLCGGRRVHPRRQLLRREAGTRPGRRVRRRPRLRRVLRPLHIIPGKNIYYYSLLYLCRSSPLNNQRPHRVYVRRFLICVNQSISMREQCMYLLICGATLRNNNVPCFSIFKTLAALCHTVGLNVYITHRLLASKQKWYS